MTAAMIAIAGAVLAAGAIASLRPRRGPDRSRAARQFALALLEERMGRAAAREALGRAADLPAEVPDA